MTRQIVITPSHVNRRQPLLSNQDSSSRRGVRFAEVAGGTTAECAAICCCCPCGIVNLILLAIYKVPAGLCRKALKRNRRRRLMKRGLLPQKGNLCECGCDDTELHIHSIAAPVLVKSKEMDEDVKELEKEMWDKFYGTGFWRSHSQKSE